MAVTKTSSKTLSPPPPSRVSPRTAPHKTATKTARAKKAIQNNIYRDQLGSIPQLRHKNNDIKAFSEQESARAQALQRQQGGQLGLLLTKGVSSSVSNGGATPTAQSTQPAPDAPPAGYDGEAGFDLGESARIIRDNLDLLDSAAGGRRDGKFGLEDMEAVAADENAPPELRQAVENFLADPNALNALDVAGGPRVDRKFSKKDLDRVISEADENRGGMSLDEATDILREEENFKRLDAAKNGREDGKISREDLEIVAADESAPDKLREAAQAVLDNDNLFNAMDVGRSDKTDGLISKDDLSNINYSPTPEEGRQWRWGDELALRRSLKDGVNFDDDLFGGIHQTNRGNCVSTAIIKGAMDEYGNEVFTSAERNAAGGYDVTLQDGTEVSVTREELEAAATGAHFEGDSQEATSFATLCYAVMAKRAQQLGHEGSETYAEALRSLANGENPMDTVKFLGLQDKIEEIDVDEIPDHDGVVAWGNGHAVYVDTRDGETYTDAWGDQREYDGTNQTGKDESDLEHAFYFV